MTLFKTQRYSSNIYLIINWEDIVVYLGKQLIMQQHIFLAYNLHVAFKREPAKSEVFYLEFLLEQTKIVV